MAQIDIQVKWGDTDPVHVTYKIVGTTSYARFMRKVARHLDSEGFTGHPFTVQLPYQGEWLELTEAVFDRHRGTNTMMGIVVTVIVSEHPSAQSSSDDGMSDGDTDGSGSRGVGVHANFQAAIDSLAARLDSLESASVGSVTRGSGHHM